MMSWSERDLIVKLRRSRQGWRRRIFGLVGRMWQWGDEVVVGLSRVGRRWVRRVVMVGGPEVKANVTDAVITEMGVYE